MDGLIFLVGLLLLAIPVTVIGLLISHIRLSGQVRELNQRVSALNQIRSPTDGTQSTPVQDDNATPVSPIGTKPVPARAERKPVWNTQKPTADDTRSAPADRTVSDIMAPQETPARVVLRRERVTQLSNWMKENWFYAVAAVSLALAGIFLVQYGIETGLLTPTMRVLAALALGAALIGGGDYIRRRFGDAPDSATAYLPAVLCGAGLVSLFGGVLAARVLYDLIAPGTALVALFGVALLGLVLGWLHGPLLAAIGLIGGFAAPFLVGGQSDRPEWLLGYFAILAALGLGIDTLRRWAWVSVLAVAGAFAAAWLLAMGTGGSESFAASFMAFGAGLAILATLIPARAVIPDHDGPPVTEALLRKGATGWPIFPARVSLGTLAIGSACVATSAAGSAQLFWMAAGLCVALAAVFIWWSRPAPALQDHAAVPVIALLALIGLQDLHGPLLSALRDARAAQLEVAEPAHLWPITWLFGMPVVVSLLAAWRSFGPGRFGVIWAAAAVLIAPVAGLTMELTWQPTALIGAPAWALHALGLAGLMTLLAERYARTDKDDHLRMALAALSALACLAFALSVVLTEAALTLALATTVVAAAALDRRFDLKPMTAYIAAGIVAVGYRLTVDPGLPWADRAPLWEIVLAYGGTCAAMLAGLWLLRPLVRDTAKVMLDSAAWSAGGMTLSLVLLHLIQNWAGRGQTDSHWSIGLQAVIWIGLALAQVQRLPLGGRLRHVRLILTAVFALIGVASLLMVLGPLNPLLGHEQVLGPVLFNTLAPAYLMPAIVLGLGALRLTRAPRRLRQLLGGSAVALAAFWAALVIRHYWQNQPDINIARGVSQPELYSYTVALMLVGAVLFYQAMAKRSDKLRKAGVAVIGLTVVKVFLIDASGLSGLVRVFSFLLLGLSLAGLAWLNRWLQTTHTAPETPDSSDASDDPKDPETPENSGAPPSPTQGIGCRCIMYHGRFYVCRY